MIVTVVTTTSFFWDASSGMSWVSDDPWSMDWWSTGGLGGVVWSGLITSWLSCAWHALGNWAAGITIDNK